MTNWTADELGRVGDADELEIASTRADGSLRKYVTIWAVRVGDGIYVRSAHGPDNPWYRRAAASGTGRIRAGGVEKDVSFAAVDDVELQHDIDAAYHSKYDHYPKEFVDPVVGEHSYDATFRLVPLELSA